MSVLSVLGKIGSDVKKVFDWISSPQGQTVIQTGEGVVETIYPPAAGLITLANATLAEIVKVEALAAGAGVQTGSGVQKLAAVTASITPEVLSYAQANGLKQPTSTEIQSAVNALVAFANAFTVKA